jgi:hypothetical protein
MHKRDNPKYYLSEKALNWLLNTHTDTAYNVLIYLRLFIKLVNTFHGTHLYKTNSSLTFKMVSVHGNCNCADIDRMAANTVVNITGRAITIVEQLVLLQSLYGILQIIAR